ncbi:hypothetical protein LV457_16280 [Mycobacterium sp. MYCO198283]|uniref:hypothetical protein n=1 Tax=Mycobacterium sp. MYCO198283 TaxID=2883505 RepID=UPI001E58CD24|nr:hypothetical protein [Mycobacterium sp. MYCO198283]MCG5433834.1 hypothetical protein [Mycobacterium sp. MYCO198283]
MTTQEVDPQTYYDVGNGLFTKAAAVFGAFRTSIDKLGSTAAMAGSDDAGTAWAASYDQRAREVLDAVNDLTAALENYGGVIIQAGYNHAVGEYHAHPAGGGAAPVKPPEPATAVSTLSAPPSAGGPGRGLLDDGLGLVERLGVPVPDGDTHKLEQAGMIWTLVAGAPDTTAVLAGLDHDVAAFAGTSSPEVEHIAADLRELRDAASAIAAGCRELAQSCRDYKTALDELREKLADILEDLAIELAVGGTIAIATAFISFGASAVAGAANAARAISKFARIVTEAIAAWKLTKNITKGVKRAHDLAGARRKLQRIKQLRRRGLDTGAPRPRRLEELFAGRTPTASELEEYALAQGWTKVQSPTGPAKYVDANGVERMVIKRGSGRVPGSEDPHVALRDAYGRRIDPYGNPVPQRSDGNHTPIEWDW